VPDRRS